MELFKLFGRIAVENSEANESIDETSEKAESFGSKFKSVVGKVAKGGIAITSAAIAAGTGFAKFAEKSASTADEIDKMSQRLGLSKKGYQEWAYVLSQSGVDVNSMQVGMKTLTNSIDDAINGNDAAIEKFKRLGISIDDLKGKSREDIFSMTITGLQNVADGTEKAALANDMFGRSGQEIIPLLNETAESTEALKNKANELGMVMSDDVVDSGVSLTDTLDTLKRAFGSIVTKLGAALMPMLETVCKYIIDILPQISTLFGRLTPILTQLFDSLLPPLMNLAEQLFPVIINLIETLIPPITQIMTAILPIITELLNQLLPPIIEIVQMLLPPLMEIFNALMPLLQTLIDLLMPIIDLVLQLVMPIVDLIVSAITPLVEILANLINTILQPIIPIIEMLAGIINDTLSPIFEALSPIITQVFDALSPLMEALGQLMTSILEPLMPVIEAVAKVLSNTLGAAFKALQPIIDGIMDVFGGLIDFITGVFSGNWEQAWNGIVGLFKGIFNLIPSVIEFIINGAIGLINTLLDGINWCTGWLGIPEIPHIPEVQLPRFAKGGVVEEQTTALIGEDGAEAVVPLEHNTGWIRRVAEQLSDYIPSNNVDNMVPVDTLSATIETEIGQKIANLEVLVINVVEMLKQFFPQLLDAFNVTMVLDDGTLVAKLTPKIDKQLGTIIKRKERG